MEDEPQQRTNGAGKQCLRIWEGVSNREVRARGWRSELGDQGQDSWGLSPGLPNTRAFKDGKDLVEGRLKIDEQSQRYHQLNAA